MTPEQLLFITSKLDALQSFVMALAASTRPPLLREELSRQKLMTRAVGDNSAELCEHAAAVVQHIQAMEAALWGEVAGKASALVE